MNAAGFLASGAVFGRIGPRLSTPGAVVMPATCAMPGRSRGGARTRRGTRFEITAPSAVAPALRTPVAPIERTRPSGSINHL